MQSVYIKIEKKFSHSQADDHEWLEEFKHLEC